MAERSSNLFSIAIRSLAFAVCTYAHMRSGLPAPPLHDGGAHLDISGRDRDRTVERSTQLEGVDQRRGLLGIGTREREVKGHRIERRQISARLLGAIERAVDAHR
jgi:hypothetical protein